MSTRTVDTVVHDLTENGMLAKSPLRLGPAFGFVLSIAIGVETLRAGLIDPNGDALCTVDMPRSSDDLRKLDPTELLDRVVACVDALMVQIRDQLALSPGSPVPLLGIATAWPSPVRGSGRPAGPGLSSEWQDPAARGTLREEVAARLGMPVGRVHAMNDAFAHGLAISFDKSRVEVRDFAAQGDSDLATKIAIFLRVGGGLGVSTMLLEPNRSGRIGWIDSRLLGGSRSIAGGLAHLPVDPKTIADINSASSWTREWLAPMDPLRPCGVCGSVGHLDGFVSGLALQERVEQSDISREDLHAVLRDIDVGSRTTSDDVFNPVHKALTDIGTILGIAMAGPVLLLDPSIVVLSGSLAREPVRRGIDVARERWMPAWGEQMQIETVPPDSQPLVGVRGAALAVFRRHVHRKFDYWGSGGADTTSLLHAYQGPPA